MGSQTTIVSRSGTNQLSGDVFEYLRNNVLDARNYFDPTLQSGHLGGSRYSGVQEGISSAARWAVLEEGQDLLLRQLRRAAPVDGQPALCPY